MDQIAEPTFELCFCPSKTPASMKEIEPFKYVKEQNFYRRMNLYLKAIIFKTKMCINQ
jgi:hypothetical protein